MAIIFLIYGCNNSIVSNRSESFGEFDIPNEFLISSKFSGKTKNDDNYGPIALVWEGEYVNKNVSSYIPANQTGKKRSITALLYINNLAYMDLPRRHKDAYLLEGLFSNGNYFYDKELELYQVNRDIETTKYDLLKTKPDNNLKLPSNILNDWVASCHFSKITESTKCSLELAYKNHFVIIKLDKINFQLRDEIKEFVVNELERFRHSD